MKRISLALTSLALLSCATQAAVKPVPRASTAKRTLSQAVKPVLPPISFTQYRLKNGLRVILHEDHSAPIVTTNLWYHVGSKDEVSGRTGFAHLFEHMMFQGSKNYDDDYFKPLQEAGAQVNGSTSPDRTNYYTVLPSNYLELALFLEADRLGGLLPAMTQAKLDNQRAVVQNEKRQSYDNRPYGQAGEKIAAALYPANHPYHWLTIGSMQDLDAASLDDVKQFFRRYYVPNNASLVVAGDFKPQQARAWIQKYFGPVARGQDVKPLVPRPTKLTHEVRTQMEDRVVVPRLYITWPTVPAYTKDDAALDTLGEVLSGGKSSRLYKSLVYDKQIAQSVSAYHYSRELAGEFAVVVTARPGHSLQELEAAVKTQLQRIQAAPPSKDEIERAYNERESSFIYSLQEIGGFGSRSDQLNSYATFMNDPGAFNKDLARYRAVKAGDVQRVAKQYLTANRVVLSVVPQGAEAPAAQAPAAQAPKAITPTSPAGTQAQNKTAAQAAVPSGAAPPAAQTMASDANPKSGFQSPKLPKPGPDPTLRLPQIQRATLSNGLKIMLVEQHEIPVVTMNMVIKTGSEADPQGKAGLASLTASLLDEGTKTRSSLQLSDALARIGANVNAGANFDGSNINALTTTRHLDAALNLFADIALNPAFPAAEVERVRASLLTSLAQRRDNPTQIADALYPVLLYGRNHPYGHAQSGEESDARAITRADIANFYATYYRPNNATLIVVGDAKLSALKPKLERAFGNWKSASVPAVDVSAQGQGAGPKLFLVDKPGAAQSVVTVGQIGVARDTPDFFAVRVLNTLLGGQFTSRINMNLREDKGYTYGANSSFDFRRGAGPFEVSASVKTDVTALALQEILNELNGVRGTNPVGNQESESSKGTLIRSYVGGFETPAQIAARLQLLVLYDLPDSYFNTYIANVRGVGLPDVEQAAQTRITPDNLTILIVGDRSKIEASLRALSGVGDSLTVVDAQGLPTS